MIERHDDFFEIASRLCLKGQSAQKSALRAAFERNRFLAKLGAEKAIIFSAVDDGEPEDLGPIGDLLFKIRSA